MTSEEEEKAGVAGVREQLSKCAPKNIPRTAEGPPSLVISRVSQLRSPSA